MNFYILSQYYFTANKFPIIDQLPFERRQFLTHLPAPLLNLNKIKEANAKVLVLLKYLVSFLKKIILFLSFMPVVLNLFKPADW